MVLNECDMAKEMGIDLYVLRSIIGEIGTNNLPKDQSENAVSCPTHIFIKMDSKDDYSQKWKERKYVKNSRRYKVVEGDAHQRNNSYEHWETEYEYYPEIRYKYHFYQCACCKKNF